MTFAAHWTREGPLSGPANLLNNRWEVAKVSSRRPARLSTRWGVWDRGLRSWVHDGSGQRTMREARAEALRIGQRAIDGRCA